MGLKLVTHNIDQKPLPQLGLGNSAGTYHQLLGKLRLEDRKSTAWVSFESEMKESLGT